ncbi:hypothetical protein BCJMU51_p2004 (plasmid) [Bacillus cereus]|uniref:hypothetical protein n=1 Tax=Bacillus cereus TaxID=1396 RepID=UPI001F3E684A|nr:hypothetical protein [Bacillus cereus]BCC74149.1 hypothetical protein BCJMU51_p2004 [Bacillus cereus]BCD15089.1 hypothetical protein BC30075_p113 [Bacillus cereus]BCD21079.1 hypothetical protein BC30077_p282 [Bacillus cereus]
MIFIKLSPTGSIEFIHYDPLNSSYGLGTEEELKELEVNGKGVLLEQLPESQGSPGKLAVLKYDKEKGLYYEYVDAPITPEEVVEDLKKQQESLQQENSQLGQQVSELEIQLLQKEQESTLLGQQISEMEIKQLKSDKDVALLGQQVSSLEVEVLKLQPTTGGTN